MEIELVLLVFKMLNIVPSFIFGFTCLKYIYIYICWLSNMGLWGEVCECRVPWAPQAGVGVELSPARRGCARALRHQRRGCRGSWRGGHRSPPPERLRPPRAGELAAFSAGFALKTELFQERKQILVVVL